MRSGIGLGFAYGDVKYIGGSVVVHNGSLVLNRSYGPCIRANSLDGWIFSLDAILIRNENFTLTTTAGACCEVGSIMRSEFSLGSIMVNNKTLFFNATSGVGIGIGFLQNCNSSLGSFIITDGIFAIPVVTGGPIGEGSASSGIDSLDSLMINNGTFSFTIADEVAIGLGLGWGLQVTFHTIALHGGHFTCTASSQSRTARSIEIGPLRSGSASIKSLLIAGGSFNLALVSMPAGTGIGSARLESDSMQVNDLTVTRGDFTIALSNKGSGSGSGIGIGVGFVVSGDARVEVIDTSWGQFYITIQGNSGCFRTSRVGLDGLSEAKEIILSEVNRYCRSLDGTNIGFGLGS
jgi:hypothetical protein